MPFPSRNRSGAPAAAGPRLLPRPAPRRSLLSLWHLLSLDAPTIATLWTAAIGVASGVRLPVTSLCAMFLAVWILYAADRLLDARWLDAHPGRPAPASVGLEARHLFHHRHRRRFLTVIVFACGALAPLLSLLNSAALRLDLLLGTLLVCYFVLIHATPGAGRLPKEVAVGLIFSAAVFIPTVARRPDLRLVLLPMAMLFAALCSLNCLFIYAWEHPERRTLPHRVNGALFPSNEPLPHGLSRLHARFLPALTLALILLALALSALQQQLLLLAIALSGAALLLLHARRKRLGAVTLRATADLALATPLLLLPVLLLRR